jgi:hypothetical protein
MIAGSLDAAALSDHGMLRRCSWAGKIQAAALGARLVLWSCLFFIISVDPACDVSALRGDTPLRIAVAVLIALTVFQYDRAILRPARFRGGYVCRDNPPPDGAKIKASKMVLQALDRCDAADQRPRLRRCRRSGDAAIASTSSRSFRTIGSRYCGCGRVLPLIQRLMLVGLVSNSSARSFWSRPHVWMAVSRMRIKVGLSRTSTVPFLRPLSSEATNWLRASRRTSVKSRRGSGMMRSSVLLKHENRRGTARSLDVVPATVADNMRNAKKVQDGNLLQCANW